MKYLAVSVLSISILFSVSSLYSQVVTENVLTVEEYVQTILLGEGVLVSNVTYNGMPANQVQSRIGYINGENSDFYFDEAFMMCTRNIDIASCGPEDFTGAGPGTEPDLFQISGQNLLDVTVVEFDFIPQGDTVSFNFVFASREYSGFVCSSYNDVFGFFLSGPGINGPFSNSAVNIALLPDGVTPVTINNVNNGANDFFGGGTGLACSYAGNNCPCNSEFFTDNGSGIGTGLHSDLCFGGYTVPLVAQSLVQCGETYHIKLAIANATDGGLQSAVFLQAGSFASSLVINVDLAVSNGFNDSTLTEGCSSALLTFEREQDNIEQTIYLTIGGTATNGVDYTLIPDSLVFEIGVTTISIEIEAFHDGIIEGLESVIIAIENENICSDENLQSNLTFYIDEYDPLEVIPHDGLVDCGEPIVLEPEATGGSPPLSFLWNTGETSTSISVAPIESTTYSLTVTDSCGIYEETVEFFVEVPLYDTLLVDIQMEQGSLWVLNCFSEVYIDPVISGGSGDFEYEWYLNGQLVSNDLVWNELIEGDGSLWFIITDHCGNTHSDTIDFVTPTVFTSVEVWLCGGEQYVLPGGTTVAIAGLYTDTIASLVTGCDSIVATNVSVITVDAGEYAPSCTGQFTTILNGSSVPHSTDATITWSGSDNVSFGDVNNLNTVLTAKGSGAYTIELTDSRCPDNPDIALVIMREPPQGTFIELPQICFGENPTLQLELTGDYSLPIVWTDEFAFYMGEEGNSITINTADYTDLLPEVTYTISATIPGLAPCPPDFVSTVISIVNCDIEIPNIFTPNGDGINDSFAIPGIEYFPGSRMVIYSRWGKKVYESDSYGVPFWNGTNMNSGDRVADGVYFYELTLSRLDRIEKGTITLLRNR